MNVNSIWIWIVLEAQAIPVFPKSSSTPTPSSLFNIISTTFIMWWFGSKAEGKLYSPFMEECTMWIPKGKHIQSSSLDCTKYTHIPRAIKFNSALTWRRKEWQDGLLLAVGLGKGKVAGMWRTGYERPQDLVSQLNKIRKFLTSGREGNSKPATKQEVYINDVYRTHVHKQENVPLSDLKYLLWNILGLF